MNDAGVMRSGERIGDLNCDIDGFAHSERPGGHSLTKSWPFDVLHRDEGTTILGLADFVNHADVWMTEDRSRARLLFESTHAAFVASEIIWQQFQRDAPAELGVACEINFTHAALSNQRKN